MATIKFNRIGAACGFASMAEGMAEVQRDNGDTFAADQLDVLAQDVWAEKLDDVTGTVALLDHQVEFAQMVLENCLDNASGRGPFVEGEDDADDVYPGDVEIIA